jgi:chaperonin GroEL (HSP60 family)
MGEIMNPTEHLLGEDVRQSEGEQARRYNLLAAKLISELIKSSLGPRGFEKMYIDLLGEITLTKDGATILRKIDVEHPAAKVLIEASNAVDNEVGDGTISVVVLAGSLVEKTEELLDMGISPSTIETGYIRGLEIALKTLEKIAKPYKNSDRSIMEKLANTCLASKAISFLALKESIVAKLVVDAFCTIADFVNNKIEVDDIKIEEKPGNTSDIQLVKGIVIDKTIDNSGMPRLINNAKILLINEELDDKRTKTDAEIIITSPNQIQSYLTKESDVIKLKTRNIINSGANVVISQKGINLLAQHYLAKAGIISVKRVKENDLFWLQKATGATITNDLENISEKYLGYAGKVYEKFVGDDKMVLVDDCRSPKSVTLLLRANSKMLLDEYHRSVLDAISVLKDFFIKPLIVGGGGSVEAIIADRIRNKARSISGREQIVIQKFADALEEIPLTIARNAGMNVVDVITQLRSKNSMSSEEKRRSWYGIDAIERKVKEMFSQNIIDPYLVKEQILKTAIEVTIQLIRVDHVLMAKPVMYTHTHADGTTHTHAEGQKKHDHFDNLGKQQRPSHHYY